MRLVPLGLVALVALGCGKSATGPTLDPMQFPKSVADLEGQIEAVFAAFEAGDPKAADRPLHQVGKAFSTIKNLAGPAGLSDQQQTVLDDATSNLLEALGELHDPMHEEKFPEDFDFAPVRARIEEGLGKLRSALPEAMVAQLDEAAAKRAAVRPPAPTPKADEATSLPVEDAPPVDGPIDTPDPNTPPIDLPAEAPAVAPDPADGAAGGAATPFRLASNRTATRAPLGPSVMLFDADSMRLAPERIARAADLVRGAPPGDRWVQLVPTLHAHLNDDLSIAAYGQMASRTSSWSDPANFAVADDALADRFRDLFAAAIAQAVARGLNVSLLPHLDPAGGPVEEWRNLYRFRPSETIGAGSYQSLLLEPLAAAIEAEASSTTRIDFALSGEMGRSLFEHPADYLDLVRTLRARFAKSPRTQGVQLGVALNWSGLAGGSSDIDRDAVAKLFAELDFVGFSCYAPVSVPPTADDFARATRNFLNELQSLGGAVAPNARLVHSEAGLGGGYVRSASGTVQYASPQEVADRPFEGRGNGARNPWRDPALAALRTQYHAALCKYLLNQNAKATPIDKAFLWSEGPWDPQGVADRRFRDEAIAAAIDRHNAG